MGVGGVEGWGGVEGCSRTSAADGHPREVKTFWAPPSDRLPSSPQERRARLREGGRGGLGGGGGPAKGGGAMHRVKKKNRAEAGSVASGKYRGGGEGMVTL